MSPTRSSHKNSGMTIEKGQPWGTPGALPSDGIVVRTDAEARAIVERARRAGAPVPALGLLGGDLCRTVGGAGDEARLRSADAVQLPVDLGAALIDGRLHWFVAHLVVRRRWWRGARIGTGTSERSRRRAAPRPRSAISSVV